MVVYLREIQDKKRPNPFPVNFKLNYIHLIFDSEKLNWVINLDPRTIPHLGGNNEDGLRQKN